VEWVKDIDSEKEQNKGITYLVISFALFLLLFTPLVIIAGRSGGGGA
jgi:hypothetical protein